MNQKTGELSRGERDAMAAWRMRELTPDEYVNYHNFHISVLGDDEHGYSVAVCAYFYLTEPAGQPFKTKKQALAAGKKCVNRIRKMCRDKAYKLKYQPGFLFGK